VRSGGAERSSGERNGGGELGDGGERNGGGELGGGGERNGGGELGACAGIVSGGGARTGGGERNGVSSRMLAVGEDSDASDTGFGGGDGLTLKTIRPNQTVSNTAVRLRSQSPKSL